MAACEIPPRAVGEEIKPKIAFINHAFTALCQFSPVITPPFSMAHLTLNHSSERAFGIQLTSVLSGGRRRNLGGSPCRWYNRRNLHAVQLIKEINALGSHVQQIICSLKPNLWIPCTGEAQGTQILMLAFAVT